MRCYEHTLIARQDLSPQQAQALADTYSGVLTEHGGEVTKTEYWGLRNLSYRIKKNRKGHYLHLNVRAPAEAIAELERQERLSDDVLRYLTVKVDALDEGPSILMQSRSSREERSRRPHDDDERPRRAREEEERPRRARGEGAKSEQTETAAAKSGAGETADAKGTEDAKEGANEGAATGEDES